MCGPIPPSLLFWRLVAHNRREMLKAPTQPKRTLLWGKGLMISSHLQNSINYPLFCKSSVIALFAVTIEYWRSVHRRYLPQDCFNLSTSSILSSSVSPFFKNLSQTRALGNLGGCTRISYLVGAWLAQRLIGLQRTGSRLSWLLWFGLSCESLSKVWHRVKI
jgi:hypothetical protein